MPWVVVTWLFDILTVLAVIPDKFLNQEQSWALSVFLNLFNNKTLFFALFIKLI